MSDTGTLRVWTETPLDGETVRIGVPVAIRRIDERIHGHRTVERVIAPITLDPNDAVRVLLHAGEYELEAMLPSGEMIYHTTTVIEDASADVRLEPTPSPNEWWRWNHFGGSRHLSPKSLAFLTREPEGVGGPGRSLWAAAGSAVQTSIGPFNPASWSEWVRYLTWRWDERRAIATVIPEMQAVGHHVDTFYPRPQGPALVEIKDTSAGDDRRRIGQQRNFLSLSTDWGTHLVSIPMPWGRDRDSRARLNVLVHTDREQTIVDYSLADPQFGGLIAYLNSGRAGVAAGLIPALNDALYGKDENPLATAACGYVVLATDDNARREGPPEWLNHLLREFPDLPDAYILLGKYLRDHAYGGSDDGSAHELFYAAYEHGVPFFSAGVSWLIEGLRGSAPSCDICERMLREVRSVAAYMDLTGAFTSFRLERPRYEAYGSGAWREG